MKTWIIAKVRYAGWGMVMASAKEMFVKRRGKEENKSTSADSSTSSEKTGSAEETKQ